jgi:hypothetical protein
LCPFDQALRGRWSHRPSPHAARTCSRPPKLALDGAGDVAVAFPREPKPLTA